MTRLALISALAGALVVASCTTGGDSTTSSAPAPSANVPTSSSPVSTLTSAPTSKATSATTTAKSPATTAQQVLASLSLQERVGQLLMVDCPTTSVTAATLNAIKRDRVGSVILDGNSTEGVRATATVTTALENANPGPAKLFIATDQEGGAVQRLNGAGFTAIPMATAQGHLDPVRLQHDATGWARQLSAAGVNVNLGPVLDVVPNASTPNPPIGDLDRQFGSTADRVTSHGLAVIAGMKAGGVLSTVKHFPGLGRVTGNTDTTAGVTDPLTSADDPNLAPFAAAVKAGVPLVMMSTAIYSKIDAKNPAAFSSTVIALLRGKLGFHGVVISDDLGAAEQVASVRAGERAVRFVNAGGDIVLTVDASVAHTMTQALSAKATSDPAFRAKIDAAALRVLTAKQAAGLLA